LPRNGERQLGQLTVPCGRAEHPKLISRVLRMKALCGFRFADHRDIAEPAEHVRAKAPNRVGLRITRQRRVLDLDSVASRMVHEVPDEALM
jgi:hypothetical protein